MLVLALMAMAQQQVTTTCQMVGNQQVCTSQLPREQVAPTGYLDAMGGAYDYNTEELKRQQIKALQLQNAAMERANVIAAANTATAKECRKAASDALKVNDLGLARDVLNRCVK